MFDTQAFIPKNQPNKLNKPLLLICKRGLFSGVPKETRTPDRRLRRPLLYPTELWAQMERVKGIEPSQSAWKADVLPLNYTRLCVFINIIHVLKKSSVFFKKMIFFSQKSIEKVNAQGKKFSVR